MNILAVLVKRFEGELLSPKPPPTEIGGELFLTISQCLLWCEENAPACNTLVLLDEKNIHHVLREPRQVEDICFVRGRGFPSVRVLHALSLPKSIWEGASMGLPPSHIHEVGELSHPKGTTVHICDEPTGPYQVGTVAGMGLRNGESVIFATDQKGDPFCEDHGYVFRFPQKAAA